VAQGVSYSGVKINEVTNVGIKLKYKSKSIINNFINQHNKNVQK